MNVISYPYSLVRVVFGTPSIPTSFLYFILIVVIYYTMLLMCFRGTIH